MPAKEQAPRANKVGTRRQPVNVSVEDRDELAVQQEHPAAIVQRARQAPQSLTSVDVLQLQRTIGNQAVVALLAGLERRPAGQSGRTAGPVPDPGEQEGERAAEQEGRRPAPAGEPGRGGVVQRKVLVKGRAVAYRPASKTQQAILKNWQKSKTVHNFQGKTEAKALEKLEAALALAEPRYKKPIPALFRKANLRFLTQAGGRMPTLYFKQGAQSGRIRQQHGGGPAIKEEQGKIDYFFPTKQEAKDFMRAARAAKQSNTFFDSAHGAHAGATADPLKGYSHVEVTFSGPGIIQKTHLSMGTAEPDTSAYNSDKAIKRAYHRATGEKSDRAWFA